MLPPSLISSFDSNSRGSPAVQMMSVEPTHSLAVRNLRDRALSTDRPCGLPLQPVATAIEQGSPARAIARRRGARAAGTAMRRGRLRRAPRPGGSAPLEPGGAAGPPLAHPVATTTSADRPSDQRLAARRLHGENSFGGRSSRPTGGYNSACPGPNRTALAAVCRNHSFLTIIPSRHDGTCVRARCSRVRCVGPLLTSCAFIAWALAGATASAAPITWVFDAPVIVTCAQAGGACPDRSSRYFCHCTTRRFTAC